MRNGWLRATAALALAAGATYGQDLEPGFQRLFDGQSLNGWTSKGGRYDGNAEWSVVDGCIVGREGPEGAGGLLYTEKSYASFEIRLEAFLDFPFDSGVFCRMRPDAKGAQVTLDHRPDGQIGAIYSDGYLEENKQGAEHWKKGEWNDVRVRCTGFDMRLEFWLNGEKLTDYQIPENPEKHGLYASTGLIGIQVHGGGAEGSVARFRNIRVRELPIFGEEPLAVRAEAPLSQLLRVTEAGKQAGWEALFNAKDLTGWKIEGEEDRYVVQEGILGFQARGGGGHLYTEEDFTDFRLRLDFKIAKMANSGVFLRAARDGSNPAYSGCEIQILDDFNWEQVTGSKLKAYQLTGGLYGSLPAGNHRALHPIGDWNTYEILYRGARIAVALNGKMLYDAQTEELVPLEGEPFPRRAKAGFIGLQHHGAHNIEAETMIQFRNLFVQRL